MQAPYPVLYQVKIECKAFTLRIGLVTVPVHVYSGTLFMSDEIDEWIRNDGVRWKIPYCLWQSRGHRFDSDMLHEDYQGITELLFCDPFLFASFLPAGTDNLIT